MNYVSGENSGCFGGERKERRLDRKRHFPCQVFIALNSNTGGAGPLPIIATPLTTPINVVSVTIDADCDARRFEESHHDEGCYNDRVNILLIFTAIINLPATVVATLNFQLVRTTNRGVPVTVGPTFTFATTAAVLTSTSFAFQYFDTGLEPDDYTYSVILAPGTTLTVLAGVTITNATLSAIAVS